MRCVSVFVATLAAFFSQCAVAFDANDVGKVMNPILACANRESARIDDGVTPANIISDIVFDDHCRQELRALSDLEGREEFRDMIEKSLRQALTGYILERRASIKKN